MLLFLTLLFFSTSITSIYRGILPPLLIEAPKHALKFAANEQYTVAFQKLLGHDKVTQSVSLMAGVGAGATEAALIVPSELVKVRMQDRSNVSQI